MAVVVAGLALFVGFLALGGWQVQRLAWKTHLIAQVDARVHAAAVPAPGPTQWAGVTRDRDQYRRVTVRGRFLHNKETLVQAVTDAGGGFWVMTPLVDDRGFTVLINRGFVPSGRRDPAVRADGQVEGPQTVTGLLRITEPKGGFLRANDPAGDRWRSRDVAAIAARRDLTSVAPYFIDADASPNPGGWPRGGLTVIRFANSHLVYALTWFGMALLTVVGLWLFLRDSRRNRS
ncbi:SURF1 family protein [Brevundimonas sp. C43]|uniref:SURF1 family protein n=1 Tax=Brevundimonas sp. C43 TaxID=3068314 RepID=UPI00273FBAA1|nr:SURF1 family protein [Brevundimonas sp. C43]